ncbi:MAG: hypothetical protein INR71_03440 [Terriglobus roseus]|nr:hypothetical protein [Terriglobus roseus]
MKARRRESLAERVLTAKEGAALEEVVQRKAKMAGDEAGVGEVVVVVDRLVCSRDALACSNRPTGAARRSVVMRSPIT